MIPKFTYSADETRALWQAKQKQLHRAMNRSYLVRLFYAIRWKYLSNEIFMGLVDAFTVWAGLGIICAVMMGISIVEYVSPHLKTKYMGTIIIVIAVIGATAVGYILYQIFRGTEPLPKPMPEDKKDLFNT